MRQLQSPDGKPDGQRRARILRYLYDSRFLIENALDVSTQANECEEKENALSDLINKANKSPANSDSARTLETLAQFELDRKLTNELKNELTNKKIETGCNLARLVPLRMDFSYANLEGAFLNNAALPFINLSHADLRGAQLRNADLRFANLKNVNLKGADLTGAKLQFANLTNAELRHTTGLESAKLDGSLLFYSTHDTDKGAKFNLSALSWESTEIDHKSIFCPLDQRANPKYKKSVENQIEPISQANAKCNNRTYSGYQRPSSDAISNRNWASGDFASTTLENFRLKRVHFTNANLHDAIFRYVELNDVDFTGANLDGARFEHSVLNNVDFTGASVRQMSFVDSSVERSVFKGSEYVLPIQLGDYAENLLRLSGRNMDSRSNSNLNPPSRLTQTLLRPLLLAPFPFRPSRVLIWIIPYSPELLFSTENRQSIP